MNGLHRIQDCQHILTIFDNVSTARNFQSCNLTYDASEIIFSSVPMALTRTSFVLLSLLVVAVSWTRSDNNDYHVDAKRPYHTMHKHYDETLGDNDGFVSYDEIKRALGGTQEEDWKKEIEPHDDGNKLLDATEFENWLTSFRKQEL